MSKNIIFIFFLSLAISKDIKSPKNLEYGVKTNFDKNNNEFTFTYNGQGRSYLLVNIEYNSYDLEYQHTCDTGQSHIKTVNEPGLASLFPLYNSEVQHQIKLNYEEAKSEEGGKIWINPLNNELNVDLNKKYSLKVPFNIGFSDSEELSPLTYVITKASKTVEFKFEYEEKVPVGPNEKIMTVTNPFEVCEDDDCHENVSSFEFKEGKSYTINLYLKEITDPEWEEPYYVLPSFSFADKNHKDDDDDDKHTTNSQSLRFKFWIFALAILFI